MTEKREVKTRIRSLNTWTGNRLQGLTLGSPLPSMFSSQPYRELSLSSPRGWNTGPQHSSADMACSALKERALLWGLQRVLGLNNTHTHMHDA